MKTVDAKGQNCPIPVILAKKEIDAGETDFVVEVDNKTACENLQRLAESQGYLAAVEADGAIFRIAFSKGDAAPQAAAVQPARRWSVFVGKETVGCGDNELGTSLLKMFFYTLSQSDDLPESILFMNGGVKVPTGQEQVIEHLRVLENKGVQILVCGTCLNFYGLTEQLQVGMVSNMYDILTKIQQADKVVSL